MDLYYYIFLFVFFIAISSVICQEEDKKSSMIIKSLGVSVLLLFFIFLINVVAFIFSDIFFTGEKRLFNLLIYNTIVPLVFSFFGILSISLIFEYDLELPVWYYITSAITVVITLMIYVSNLKIELGITLGAQVSPVSSVIRIIFNFLPSIIAGGYFIYKKLYK